MILETLSFGARLWLALILPFKVLFDARFAAGVAQVQVPVLPPVQVKPPDEKPTDKKPTDEKPVKEAAAVAPSQEPTLDTPGVLAVEAELDPTPALQLLALLQREGRFIDFIREDMSAFADAQIGAAARVVQEGCKRALADYVEVNVIRTEAEGAAIELAAGYNAEQTRITGNVTGQPPYTGVLAHHGWRVERITLPKLSAGHDARILAPAEVEVSAR